MSVQEGQRNTSDTLRAFVTWGFAKGMGSKLFA